MISKKRDAIWCLLRGILIFSTLDMIPYTIHLAVVRRYEHPLSDGYDPTYLDMVAHERVPRHDISPP